MGLGRDKRRSDLPPSIYGEIGTDSWCALKSCDKRFAPKTHNQRFCSPGHQQEYGVRAYQAGVNKRNSQGMKCGKITGSPSMRRILALLKKRPHTTEEIQTKARVCNPATWISALRHNGFNIPDAEYMGTNEYGSKIFRYRLLKRRR